MAETEERKGDYCNGCDKRVYPMEILAVSGFKLHKGCFRCAQCKAQLRLNGYSVLNGKLYCIPHYKQLFLLKGNYEEGFGLEQHKEKWAQKGINPAVY